MRETSAYRRGFGSVVMPLPRLSSLPKITWASSMGVISVCQKTDTPMSEYKGL